MMVLSSNGLLLCRVSEVGVVTGGFSEEGEGCGVVREGSKGFCEGFNWGEALELALALH